ncbi:MAG: hypothetical protein IKC72_06725 [Clostridia bacterium]|nr:hypothetical protein [Clostridia bacterium]
MTTKIVIFAKKSLVTVMSLGISLSGCRCRMGALNLFRRPRGEPGKPDGDGGGRHAVILGGGEKLNVGDNDVFVLHFGGSEVDRGFLSLPKAKPR